MDNGELSSLDFRFLAQELKARLKGGLVRKIYQYGRKQLLFEIFVPKGLAASAAGFSGELLLYADSKRMLITENKREAPDEPPNFCMFLRKHLMGREIQDVRQHGFDRVMEIETEDSILIFEFVPPGNVILCDKFYNIIMPLEVQKWKHREVKPKGSYQFPPSQHDVFKLEIWDFFRHISESEPDKSTIAAISAMGFGKMYATEICKRAGIRPDKAASKVTVDEATELYNIIQGIGRATREPCMYNDAVSVFPLESRGGKCTPARGLSEALDTFFSGRLEEEEHEAAEKIAKGEAERIGRIEQSREAAKEMLAGKREEKSSKAQLIYAHYDIVKGILEGVRSARDRGMSWQEIKEKLSVSSSPEAKAIKEIRENEGIIIANLEGNDVELDIRKTPEKNAGLLFEGAKKIKKKLERIERLAQPKPKPMEKIVEEIQQTLTGKKTKPKKEKKIAISTPTEGEADSAAKPKGEKASVTRSRAEVETSAEIREQKESVAKRRAKGKRWYETYRWFISSEGNIVIAGKNALQNDSAIKSRFKEGDSAFHADIHGAAFVVAKANDEGKVGLLTIKEAAEFAAAHSKAWSSGFSEVDVLQFKPGMLSKTSPDGARLPRGSFHASRPLATHDKIEVKLSIGVQVSEAGAKVFAGPLMPVRKACKYFATIQPGGIECNELAQKVKNAILAKCMPEHRRAIEALPLDEFSRHIPSGSGSLVS